MAREKFTAAQAEADMLAEILRRHEKRVLDDSLLVAIVTPVEHLEEIGDRVERAAALTGSAILRVGRKFLNETDPDLH